MDVNNSSIIEESSMTQEEIDLMYAAITSESISEADNIMSEVAESETDIMGDDPLEFDEEAFIEQQGEILTQQEPASVEVPQETLQPEEEPELAPSRVLSQNSPTLLIDETTSRFSGAEWYEAVQRQDVTLVGVGGIGSYVAFLISRMKPNSLAIFDPDTVESANMSGQLYNRNQIGKFKTNAIVETIMNFSEYYSVSAVHERATRTTLLSNIVICGFDNMVARKDLFINWKSRVLSASENERDKFLFIDGRLAAEEFQVFCITGKDAYLMDKYEKDWLFSDSQAEETLCSYKQTSFCANMIASIMVNLFVNFIANQCNPLIPRELPFMTSYDASTMMFKTIMQ